jgi:hypothetical protein
VADVVLGEEGVEVARNPDDALQRVLVAPKKDDGADPGAAKRTGDDRGGRQVGSPVRFCWAAFQSGLIIAQRARVS